MVKANIRFFMKILTSVTPESVVERLVRIIIHIWLFRQNSLQRKSEFMAETSGNTEHKLALNVFSGKKVQLRKAAFFAHVRF